MARENREGKRQWLFSARERRAVLLLLPLLAVIVWIVAGVLRPRFADAAVSGNDLAESGSTDGAAASGGGEETVLSVFDPNTVTYEELRSFGLPKSTAAGVVRYREAGKVFRIPEDFAVCYGVSDSLYAVLKPYIVIGDEYKFRKRAAGSSGSSSPHRSGRITGAGSGTSISPARAVSYEFDPNTLDAAGFMGLGFTEKQARAIVNYRQSRGGFDTPEDFASSYVVSDEMYGMLKDRIVIGSKNNTVEASRQAYASEGVGGQGRNGEVVFPVDINSADSVQLVAVRGIGAKTAAAIMDYRLRLGGFCDIAQITELPAVTERNWELMREQIWADSCKIQKIDINFATPDAVAAHPYIGSRLARKILRDRQLKGGWSSIEDMIERHTLTSEEARRLAPYLHFSAQPR